MTAAAYIDPIPGATLGRIDMGQDANLPVGAPIRAPAKVTIIDQIANWFQGQPLEEFRLDSGPQAGQDQYVAEQITNLAPVGATLQQGQTIANYASSGTGIEYGWGGPNGQTLAQAQGNTGGAGHANAPAGQSIAQWLARTRLAGASGSGSSGASIATPIGGGGLLGDIANALSPTPAGLAVAASNAASSAGVSNPITSAISAVFGGFFDWLKGKAEQGFLTAALVLTGFAVAVYGVIRLMGVHPAQAAEHGAELAAVAA